MIDHVLSTWRLPQRAVSEGDCMFNRRRTPSLAVGLAAATVLLSACGGGGESGGTGTEAGSGTAAEGGWLDVLKSAGLRPFIATQPRGYADASAATTLLLDTAAPPTAVLCLSDALAYELTRVAEEMGLRVPQNLSVVSFDDSPLALGTRPPLTTVRPHVDTRGHVAAAALRAAIDRAA